MAKVYKRSGSKNWWLRFQRGGDEIRISSGTANHREAQRLLKVKVEEAERIANSGPRMTFEEACVRFFDILEQRFKDGAASRSTIESYRFAMKRWAPFCRGLCLDEIGRSKLKEFVRACQLSGDKAGTIRLRLAFMSSLFQEMIEAEEEGAPEANPVRSFSMKGLKPNKRIRFLSMGEYEALLAACNNPMHWRMIVVSVETGLRPHEVADLTWDRVYLDRRELYIADTKGGQPRVVPLSDVAVRTLRDTPRSAQSAQVFWWGDGKKFARPRSWFTRVAARAKVSDATPHTLRHTFGSWWVQSGGDLQRLQRIMGHTTIHMTLRYAHLRTDDLHHEVARVWNSDPHSFRHSAALKQEDETQVLDTSD
jgi:integrase